MTTEISLTPTSHLVLGLLEMGGESTPYELKQRLKLSVGEFWSVPHSQLYAEPARLAAAGYLDERRETGGRRRRHYMLTAKGRQAQARWRDQPTEEMPELRDLSLLKLFFGGDPRRIAQAQASAHQHQLAAYEQLQQADTGDEPRGIWLSLEAGIAHEREWVAFWRRLAEAG